MSDNLINPNLLEETFYLQSISMFLKNSYGMEDRCKMYVDILKNVESTSQALFNRLNIFYYNAADDTDYCDLNEIDPTGETDYFLDVLGSIFNIVRRFQITYFDPQTQTLSTENITLDNYEMMIYIQAIAAKYIFDGSYESLYYLYTGTRLLYYHNYSNNSDYSADDLKILTNNATKFLPINQLNIKYKTNSLYPLQCNIYYTGDTGIYNIHPNIKKLFLGGYLTIESLGIVYTRSIVSNLFRGKFGVAGDVTPGTTMRFYDELSLDTLGMFS